MEVKINREIRDYTEAMFFGLSLRQFVFSILACGVAVIVYFALKPALGLETLSWVCILAAVPFGAIGFLRYNGMTAEQFLKAFIESEILMPKQLTFGETNLYVELFRDARREERKGKRRYHIVTRIRDRQKGKENQ